LAMVASRRARFAMSARCVPIDAASEAPFDPNWLANAVEEHFDEAGVTVEELRGDA
jgi:hypothetical protein